MNQAVSPSSAARIGSNAAKAFDKRMQKMQGHAIHPCILFFGYEISNSISSVYLKNDVATKQL